MKTFVLFLLAAIVPAAVHAQDQLRIQRIGLQGFYSTNGPTPVGIHIPALDRSQTIRLLFTVESEDVNSVPSLVQTDHFEKQLELTAGKPLDVDVPILLEEYRFHAFQVLEINAQGQIIGEARDHRALRSRAAEPVVAIYCHEDAQCAAAQTQISPPQTRDEDSIPRSFVHLPLMKDLETDWLAYRVATAVVIAGSIADLTPDEAKALEYYLRSGGILILSEKEAGEHTFLAAYRQGEASAPPQQVGKGRFYRIASLESHELNKLFAAFPASGARKIFANNVPEWQSASGWMLDRVGASFTFPRLRWLLIWMGVYILVIGLVNFAILKRLRKLEWGWVSVGVTALVFAGGLYISSSSGRPKHFILDNVTIYWMDEHSPLAHEDLGFRISSPGRTQVALTVYDDVSLATPQNFRPGDDSGVYLGSDITGNKKLREGWEVQLAPPLRIQTPMRRWSFQDFFAEGFHEFPGTVHWTSAMRLKNDTGQRFSKGLYLDFKANRGYSVAALAPGEEVDLAGIAPYDLGKKSQRLGFNPGWTARRGREADRPFSLEELPYTLRPYLPDHLFTGIVESPEMKAGLDVQGTTQQGLSLAIIALDQP
jgi:hypothetical protein